MTAVTALRNKFKFDPNSPWFFYRKVLLWSFIVSACITVPFVIVEWVKTGSPIFLYYGDYNAQQICFYENCVRMVRAGDFGWDWVTDMGSNFIGSYSYYMLGSPFFWLMCIFPSSWTPYLMAPMYMVKYIVAALLAYAYLQRFVKNKNYAVIGALLYSFSGFQIYNTFFNQFHDCVAFFPLLLIGLEELVQNDRKGLFALAVMINAMINYFMFVGQVAFCIIYFMFRLPERSFKITFQKLFAIIIEAVIGVLMAMFILLPAASALMGNSRIESNFTGKIATYFEQLNAGKDEAAKKTLKSFFVWTSSDKFYWQRYGQIFESYFFPPDIPSRVNFFYGHGTRWASISMYLPMFSLSGVFAFFTVKRRTWLKSLMIALTIFSFVPVLNSIFFGFSTAYYGRWLYMMILMFVLATVISLDDERTKWKVPTAIMTFFCTAVVLPLGLIWHEHENEAKNAATEFIMKLGFPPFPARFWIYSAIAFLGIFLTAWLIRRYRGTKQFERMVLICVCSVTVLYSCIHITNGKQHSHSSKFLVDQVVEGEVVLPDPHEEFYRIDFFRTSSISTIDNLGIFWNYPTIECFHTVVPPSIMDFYPIIGVTRNVASRSESTLYGLRAFTSTKYSFIESSKNKRKLESNGTYSQKHNAMGFVYLDETEQSEYIPTQNGYDIYENQNYIPMGFAYTEFMTQSDFETYSKIERDKMLCKYLVVPDDMTSYYSQFMTRVTADEKEVANYQSFQESVAERRKMCCYEFNYSSQGFDAKIKLDKPRIVYFSVPYEENGWSATVNGKPVDVLKVTYGFVAVECEEGENEIVFEYSTPGLFVPAKITLSEKSVNLPGGVWISLAGLAAFIIYMLYYKLIKKHKAEVKFFSFEYYDDCGAFPLPDKSDENEKEEPIDETENEDNKPKFTVSSIETE